MKLAVALVLACVACDKGKLEPTRGSAAPPPAPAPVDAFVARPDAVYVRACNDMGRDLTGLEYWTFKEGALAAGACTPYREVETAYRYTSATFKIGEEEFSERPTDYVGETPLPPGLWSYRLATANAGGAYLDAHARRDDGQTVRLRACNDSKHDMSMVTAGPLTTGADVKAGTCTEYTTLQFATTDVWAQAIVLEHVLNASAPVAEKPTYITGSYTYHLDVKAGAKPELTARLVKD